MKQSSQSLNLFLVWKVKGKKKKLKKEKTKWDIWTVWKKQVLMDHKKNIAQILTSEVHLKISIPLLKI